MNASRTTAPVGSRALALAQRYAQVRQSTEQLCAELTAEDQMVQSCSEASPAKWHRAHTTWFFETFVLLPNARGYRPFHRDFQYLFNSYYVNVGDRPARTTRGTISRPGAGEIDDYRAYVDWEMERLLGALDCETQQAASLRALIELGLNHEQQHQELILTDIKHAFWTNPLRPAYSSAADAGSASASALRWIGFDGGVHAIGHDGEGFAFDNETPRHEVLLRPFRVASRLVTCGEYLEFIADGGYRRPTLWLSDGWDAVMQQAWTAPLYWQRNDGEWRQFTLGGMRTVNPAEPVAHVSYFEADAYARWAGARLATEFEWEAAATVAMCETPGRVSSARAGADGPQSAADGSFLEDGIFHPQPARHSDGLAQMFGDTWEWTSSAYSPYPGYRPLEGALGEYNGKFMCNQMVLRGGSCATPRSHIRASYRNFFPAPTRWQFSGIRLARDGN